MKHEPGYEGHLNKKLELKHVMHACVARHVAGRNAGENNRDVVKSTKHAWGSTKHVYGSTKHARGIKKSNVPAGAAMSSSMMAAITR